MWLTFLCIQMENFYVFIFIFFRLSSAGVLFSAILTTCCRNNSCTIGVNGTGKYQIKNVLIFIAGRREIEIEFCLFCVLLILSNINHATSTAKSTLTWHTHISIYLYILSVLCKCGDWQLFMLKAGAIRQGVHIDLNKNSHDKQCANC